MSQTVSQLIEDAGYDLQDSVTGETDGAVYTAAEMVSYVNRALRILDNALSGIGSDWVLNEDTVSLSSGEDSASAPTGTIFVRELWYSSNKVWKITPKDLYEKRKYIGSGTGRPYNFAHSGTDLLFDYEADDDYDLTAYYDKRCNSTAKQKGDTMPYNHEFNEAIREAIVMMAKRRNEYDLSVDAAIQNWLFSQAKANARKRRKRERRYRLGF